MKNTLSILTGILLGAALNAQSPMTRPTQEIDVTSTGHAFFFSIETEGEVSAIIFGDEGANGQNVIYAVTSDGFGLNWSAPVAISNDPTNAVKFTSKPSCRIVNGTIYATWVDERVVGTQDLYLNVSTDGGANWLGEVLVPKPVAGVGVFDDRFDFEVRPGVGGADELFFFYVWDSGGGFSDVYLVSSPDGGGSFTIPVAVSQDAIAPSRVSKLDLEVTQDAVHVAWYDTIGSPFPTVPAYRTYYQRSTDSGATWQPTDQRMTDDFFSEGNFYDRMGLSVENDVVGVFWQAVELFNVAQNGAVHARVSIDGGVSFNADEVVGGYVENETDIDRVVMEISDGNVLMAWNDNRSGNDELFVQRYPSGGTAWLEHQLTNGPRPGGAFGAELVFAGAHGFLIGGGPGLPNASVAFETRDAGLTWGGMVEVSDHPTLDLIIFVDGAYNELYDNLMVACNTDDPLTHARALRSGGFRPQTIEPMGFDGLTGMAQIRYSGFRGGVDVSAFTLFSSSPGFLPLPYPSHRNIGLTLDSLLLSSLGPLFVSTTANIGADGTGLSSVLPYSLGNPTTFYSVGVSFQLGSAEIIGLMTDVLRIDLQ